MRCQISGQEFQIPEAGQEICHTLGVPTPIISFEEELLEKLAFRNLINLFKRRCDKTGKSIISIFPQNSPFTVYDKDIWWGDSWDPLEYGEDFDFSASFFDQFHELLRSVPIFSIQNLNTENADYCNSIENSKRCYLSAVVYYNSQDVYYSYLATHSNNLYYSLYDNEGELNFYCLHTDRCYRNIHIEECSGCRDCAFSFQLEACTHCLFCSNLRHKEYYIHNQPCSPQAYNDRLAQLDLGNIDQLKAAVTEFQNIRRAAAHRATMLINCENCSGHRLLKSRDCINSFEGIESEKIIESYTFSYSRNIYRAFGFGSHSDTIFGSTSLNGGQMSAFCMWVYYCYDCMYCVNIHHCKDCFGCAGLRNKQYCLLNKQYTREEYLALKQKVIEHMQRTPYKAPAFKAPVTEWGRWFLPKSALIPYNLSFASAYFPLSRDEVIARGYSWDDSQITAASAPTTPPPLHIRDWGDEEAKAAFRCEQTGKSYNIAPQVIQAFKANNLAILPEHPLEYLRRRLAESRFTLKPRLSSKSGAPLQSVYSEAEAPVVLSEEEYREEFC